MSAGGLGPPQTPQVEGLRPGKGMYLYPPSPLERLGGRASPWEGVAFVPSRPAGAGWEGTIWQ